MRELKSSEEPDFIQLPTKGFHGIDLAGRANDLLHRIGISGNFLLISRAERLYSDLAGSVRSFV